MVWNLVHVFHVVMESTIDEHTKETNILDQLYVPLYAIDNKNTLGITVHSTVIT